jgi:hypothetical protein
VADLGADRPGPLHPPGHLRQIASEAVRREGRGTGGPRDAVPRPDSS